MIRAAAWPIVLILGAGTLCLGQEFPPPRVVPEKLPSTKADASGEKSKAVDEKAPPRSVPILFPSPPFRPAAPVVLDPRTHAWEQITNDFNVVADGGIPSDSPGPAAAACPARTHTTFGHWLRMFKARPAGKQAIELHKDGQTGEWHVGGTPPE
jgi:hypothetical protein